jgi:methionyl-tRNA formyltransferase
MLDRGIMAMRILYAGNEPHYLDTLAKHGQVVGAVCQPQSPEDEKIWGSTHARCQQQDDCRIFEPQRFVGALLDDMAFDILFVSGFHYRIPQSILQQARYAAINLHQSLLPAYRGRHPLNWAMVNGEKETGVTLHHMNERFDDGDIIVQEPVAIDPNEGVWAIFQRLVATGNGLIGRMFGRLDFTGHPQDLAKSSYHPPRSPEDGRIDWNLPARTIHNLIRAVSQPYPGAFFEYSGQSIIIEQSSVLDDISISGQPVGVPQFINGRCLVKTGSGFLWVRQLRNQDHWMTLSLRPSVGGIK